MYLSISDDGYFYFNNYWQEGFSAGTIESLNQTFTGIYSPR